MSYAPQPYSERVPNSLERSIIHQVLTYVLAQGHLVSVNDGEVWVLKQSTSIKKIKDEIGHTCDFYIKVRDKDTKDPVATMYFILGNDEGVMSNCSDNEFMAGVDKHLAKVLPLYF